MRESRLLTLSIFVPSSLCSRAISSFRNVRFCLCIGKQAITSSETHAPKKIDRLQRLLLDSYSEAAAHVAKRHSDESLCQMAGQVAAMNQVEDDGHLSRRLDFYIRDCVGQRIARTKAPPHGHSISIVKIILTSIATDMTSCSATQLLIATRPMLVVYFLAVMYFCSLASTLHQMSPVRLCECLM